ncbi:MAG TPA: hypothetical protein VI168_07305 [Croceibacterium sp.]
MAGKPLARRQLDFALAAGCERVIALGNGASPEAIALRHAAEARGVRFQCVGNTHGLLGAVPAADELLALAPGLLPEDTRALEALERGSAVLVFPAAPGVAAGFERIDIERAWAGALVLPGRLVERLADLPPDSDATAALLRIALQARVAEKRLPEQALAEGAWAIVGPGDDAAQRQRGWLKRNLPSLPGFAATRLLARLGLQQGGIGLLARARALPAFWSGVAISLAGAVGASAYGLPALGLLLVAVGALLAEFSAGLKSLRDAPFGAPSERGLPRLAPCLVDAALIVCAALAIDDDWLQSLFPPLALLGALHASRPDRWPHPAALLGDRGLLALFFAVPAALDLAEPAVMLAALTVLALDALVFRPRSRITPA